MHGKLISQKTMDLYSTKRYKYMIGWVASIINRELQQKSRNVATYCTYTAFHDMTSLAFTLTSLIAYETGPQAIFNK